MTTPSHDRRRSTSAIIEPEPSRWPRRLLGAVLTAVGLGLVGWAAVELFRPAPPDQYTAGPLSHTLPRFGTFFGGVLLFIAGAAALAGFQFRPERRPERRSDTRRR